MIGIYCIKNNQNNKLYIGQSVNIEQRFQQHKSMLKHNRHENEHLQNSWNKYGENSFEFSVIECCTENELDDLEKKYIAAFRTMDHNYGYNLESGGSINKHMSDASKAKMSKAKQGLYDGANNPMFGIHLTLSEERKKALSERLSGKGNPMYGVHLKMSDERRLKQSEMFSGSKNPFYGKHHTDEARRNMSEKKRGIKWPLDVILSRGKISVSGVLIMAKNLNHSRLPHNGQVIQHRKVLAEYANISKRQLGIIQTQMKNIYGSLYDNYTWRDD